MNLSIQQQAIDMINNAGNALSSVGDKAILGAKYFWPIFVKNQFIYGFIFSAISIVLIALIIWVVLDFRLNFNKYEKNDEVKDNKIIFGSFAATILLFSLVGFFITASKGITHLENPEYYAAQDILEKLSIYNPHK
jgi:hypothetical protein